MWNVLSLSHDWKRTGSREDTTIIIIALNYLENMAFQMTNLQNGKKAKNASAEKQITL